MDNSETDVYNFTVDQKRAMIELMAQKEEDADLLGEEPPEYNVKGRLVQLNEDLANDPTPIEAAREHRVGFKPKIVDLVASPSPDYSDDEIHHREIKQESKNSDITLAANQKESKNNALVEDVNETKENSAKENQFVVEQGGQFYVVNSNDLTSTEQDVFVEGDDSKKKDEKKDENEEVRYGSTSYTNNDNEDTCINTSAHMSPRPPLGPRPKTVVPGTRRVVHTGSLQRPRTTGDLSNSSTCLDNFTYSSPYAMTSEQKAKSRETARRIENERKENEKRRNIEEEERRKERESAFQAWLDKKLKEETRSRGSTNAVQTWLDNRNEQKEQGHKFRTWMEIREQERREYNEKAYKSWMKRKKTQMMQEKLLKRRQQQEESDGWFLRSREECDKAFKEWLKKKNAEVKKQHLMEKQRCKLYRIRVKYAKKTLALVKALKESQTFRYAEYYGYKF